MGVLHLQQLIHLVIKVARVTGLHAYTFVLLDTHSLISASHVMHALVPAPAGAPVEGPAASGTMMFAVLKCVCEKEAATERRMRSISRKVSSLPCATCMRPNAQCCALASVHPQPISHKSRVHSILTGSVLLICRAMPDCYMIWKYKYGS